MAGEASLKGAGKDSIPLVESGHFCKEASEDNCLPIPAVEGYWF